MRRIQELTNLDGKRVYLLASLDVPIEKGKVSSNDRIVSALETINYLLDHNAIVIIAGHVGRPEGKPDLAFTTKPIAADIEALIKKKVTFSPDCVGEMRDRLISEAKAGDVILLENVRFYPEEKTNDEQFARKLARGCDIYVNDDFPDAHREYASVSGVAKYLKAYAGFQVQKEVDNLSKLLHNPEKPFVLISGGAKVSDKLKILDNLLDKVDTLLVGGGMANTFLCSQRVEVGCSLFEEDFVKKSQEIMLDARTKGVKIVLPKDVVVTKAVADNARGLTVPITEVGELDIIADLGPETVQAFSREIAIAKTIFWNGSLGITEYPNFAKATMEIAKVIARSGAFSAMGGGDTAAALPEEIKDKFSFVSTAGGASLQFLEGDELPGIAILE